MTSLLLLPLSRDMLLACNFNFDAKCAQIDPCCYQVTFTSLPRMLPDYGKPMLIFTDTPADLSGCGRT